MRNNIYVGLILAISMTLLFAGIVATRSPKDDLKSAIAEGAYWNTGLFISICIEILLIESLVDF